MVSRKSGRLSHDGALQLINAELQYWGYSIRCLPKYFSLKQLLRLVVAKALVGIKVRKYKRAMPCSDQIVLNLENDCDGCGSEYGCRCLI